MILKTGWFWNGYGFKFTLGGALSREGGGRKVTALCSLSKSLHSRESAFWETRVCTVRCMRAGAGWNVTLPGTFVEAGLWSFPVPRYLFICYSSHPSSGKRGDERRGGRAGRTRDTRINYFFFVLLFFPASRPLPWPAILRDVTDRGCTYSWNAPKVSNKDPKKTLFPRKFPEIRGCSEYLSVHTIKQLISFIVDKYL